MEEQLDLQAHGLTECETRPDIPGPVQTAASVLQPALEACPDREALVGRSARYSYRQLDAEVGAAAAAMHALGVRTGTRVAACLPNDTAIVVAFLASMRLGAVWVGLNRPLAPPEKEYILHDSGAALLLADETTCSEFTRQFLSDSGLKIVPVTGTSDCEWNAAVASHRGGNPPTVAIDPFAPAAIAYTSGTTGFPKGAVHSQHNLLLPGAVAAVTGSYPEGQRHGVLLPLTILNLMVLVPLLAFQIRGTCICIDRLDPQGLSAWVREERVEHFAAVPTIYRDLLTHPEVRPEDLATLQRPEVGGAECPTEFLNLYRERFGADVSIGYGMTEAPTAVTRSLGDKPPEPGLCGRALPQLAISIRDENGHLLPGGEVGEICVEPCTDGIWAGVYTPMLGYWNKPEATAMALIDGVLHTGDMGVLADSGDLYIRGRRNDLILRGGANVYPAEVERVLQEDDAVAACAVLGIEDERLGERVVAAVQLQPGNPAPRATPGAAQDAEEQESIRERLVELCGARLARYKVPSEIRFLDALPRNAMGKIVKRELLPLWTT